MKTNKQIKSMIAGVTGGTWIGQKSHYGDVSFSELWISNTVKDKELRRRYLRFFDIVSIRGES